MDCAIFKFRCFAQRFSTQMLYLPFIKGKQKCSNVLIVFESFQMLAALRNENMILQSPNPFNTEQEVWLLILFYLYLHI
jgi:hypothetical protein